MKVVKEKLLEGSYVVRSLVHALNLDKKMAVDFLNTVAGSGQAATIERTELALSPLYPQPDIIMGGKDLSGNPLSAKILVEILPDYPLETEQVTAQRDGTDHAYVICDFEEDCNLVPYVDGVISWNQVLSFLVERFQLPSTSGELEKADAIHDVISLLSKLGLAAGKVNRDLLTGVSSLWNFQLQIEHALNITKLEESYGALVVRSRGTMNRDRWNWALEYGEWRLGLHLCLELGCLDLCITVENDQKGRMQNKFTPINSHESLGWRGWPCSDLFLSRFEFKEGFYDLSTTRQVKKLEGYIKRTLSLLR